jgi:hypothetical protein
MIRISVVDNEQDESKGEEIVPDASNRSRYRYIGDFLGLHQAGRKASTCIAHGGENINLSEEGRPLYIIPVGRK